MSATVWVVSRVFGPLGHLPSMLSVSTCCQKQGFTPHISWALQWLLHLFEVKDIVGVAKIGALGTHGISQDVLHMDRDEGSSVQLRFCVLLLV